VVKHFRAEMEVLNDLTLQEELSYLIDIATMDDIPVEKPVVENTSSNNNNNNNSNVTPGNVTQLGTEVSKISIDDKPGMIMSFFFFFSFFLSDEFN
jgi:hypothetical protein